MYDPPRCPGEPPPELSIDERSELWVDDLRTRSHRLIERGGCRSDPARLLISPTLAGGAVAWLRNDAEMAEFDFATRTKRAVPLEGGVVSVARGAGTVLNRLAPDGRRSVVVRRF
jgi:hypothetical protein